MPLRFFVSPCFRGELLFPAIPRDNGDDGDYLAAFSRSVAAESIASA